MFQENNTTLYYIIVISDEYEEELSECVNLSYAVLWYKTPIMSSLNEMKNGRKYIYTNDSRIKYC